MSPPLQVSDTRVDETKFIESDCSNFSNMEELVESEKENVLNLLSVTLNVAPAMFGDEMVKWVKFGGKFMMNGKF